MWPSSDETLTITPRPAASIGRAAACEQKNVALEVDVDDPLPDLALERLGRPELPGARVVDEHVEPAELGQHARRPAPPARPPR